MCLLTRIFHFLSPVIETSEVLRDICSGFYIINYGVFVPPLLSAPREISEPSSHLSRQRGILFSFLRGNTRLRDSRRSENSCAIELPSVAAWTGTLALATHAVYLANKFRSSQWAREFDRVTTRRFLNTFTCAKGRVQLDELNVKIWKPLQVSQRLYTS